MNRFIQNVRIGITLFILYIHIPINCMQKIPGKSIPSRPPKFKLPVLENIQSASPNPEQRLPTPRPTDNQKRKTALNVTRQTQSIQSLKKQALKELIENFIARFGNEITPQIKDELAATIAPQQSLSQNERQKTKNLLQEAESFNRAQPSDTTSSSVQKPQIPRIKIPSTISEE